MILFGPGLAGGRALLAVDAGDRRRESSWIAASGSGGNCLRDHFGRVLVLRGLARPARGGGRIAGHVWR